MLQEIKYILLGAITITLITSITVDKGKARFLVVIFNKLIARIILLLIALFLFIIYILI